jgi:hypothetical protein
MMQNPKIKTMLNVYYALINYPMEQRLSSEANSYIDSE